MTVAVQDIDTNLLFTPRFLQQESQIVKSGDVKSFANSKYYLAGMVDLAQLK